MPSKASIGRSTGFKPPRLEIQDGKLPPPHVRVGHDQSVGVDERIRSIAEHPLRFAELRLHRVKRFDMPRIRLRPLIRRLRRDLAGAAEGRRGGPGTVKIPPPRSIRHEYQRAVRRPHRLEDRFSWTTRHHAPRLERHSPFRAFRQPKARCRPTACWDGSIAARRGVIHPDSESDPSRSPHQRSSTDSTPPSVGTATIVLIASAALPELPGPL